MVSHQFSLQPRHVVSLPPPPKLFISSEDFVCCPTNYGNRRRQPSKSQNSQSKARKRVSVQSIFAPSFILSSLPQTLKRPSSPTHSTTPSLRPKPSVAENLQPSISIPTLPSPNPTTS